MTTRLGALAAIATIPGARRSTRSTPSPAASPPSR